MGFPTRGGKTNDGADATVVATRDITGRKAHEKRLEELTEELEILNRTVRHDIRNDMTVVMGWVELLEDYVDEEGEDALARIEASGDHIIELTEIARDYVASVTDAETIATGPVSLRSTIQTEIDLRRESYPEAVFVTEGEIPDVDVVANDMLSSVFRNLLNNAVQHNDAETPRVTVSCEVEDDEVVVAVADNGRGVPDASKEVIFGKGEKGLESTGTGIGLYLVRSLVDEYGGSVWVEDNVPTGAVFKVELRNAE